MSDDDIPAERTDDSPTTDAAETAVDGGAVAAEASQSRFWGVVPSGWELFEGSEIYDVNPSYTPEEEEVTYIEMDALNTELPFPKYSKKRKAADYSGKLFRKGDTLFARITPCTENGKTAFVDEMDTDVGIGSTEYAVLSPERERIHPLYLYYVAKSHPVRNYAISRMRGSTGRQRVPFDVFRRELDVALPPIAEQQSIASVLYNLDLAIENSTGIAEKSERIQRGLMQDFLHTGVDDHDEFVETQYGSIPVDWELATVREVATRIGSGGTPDTSNEEYYSGEIPWVKTDDLNGGAVTETKTKITESGLENSAAKLFPEGTVIFAMYGGSLGQNGRLGMEAAMNQACCGIVVDEDKIDPYFLHQQLVHRKNQLVALGAGTHQQNLTQSAIEKFEIFVPPLREQEQIKEVIHNAEREVRTHRENASKLSKLKQGLLQELLKGEKRVSESQIETLEKVTEYV
jgi:type I restriction enzyme S subunit